MKNIPSCITAILILLYCLSGCTKSNVNTTQQINNQHAKYIGTWKGLVTDSLKSSTDTMTMAIYRLTDTSKLEGYVKFRNIVYKINENIYFGGINFSVINFAPQCQTTSLTLNAVLENASLVLINFWGDNCDGNSLSVSGTLPMTSPTADLSNYLTFARKGHSWTWLVTNYDNTTCTYTYTMGKDYQNGVYKFTQANTCNWQNTSTIGWWYVSPQEWANMTDSLPVYRFTNFRTDAVIGTVYKKMIAQDSVVNTVESLNDNITVNGQQYFCARIHTQQWHTGSYIVNGLTWINYQVGFIKFENLITTGPQSSVHYEELVSKNF